MPVLNLDVVTMQTLDVSATVEGEPQTWPLRLDVPSSKLMRCFTLLELERTRPQIEFAVDIEGPIDFTAAHDLQTRMAVHEEQIEQETLEICGEIFRWSDPRISDEALRSMLPHHARRQVVAHFFLVLLARSGKLPSALTAASSSTDSPPPLQEQKSRSAMATKRTGSRTSTGRGSTRSAMRSTADSSQPDRRVAIQPTKTTTASGVEALIY